MALALLEVLGSLSCPALQVVRALFGLILTTGRESGSVWSYSETSGLQEEEEENGFNVFFYLFLLLYFFLLYCDAIQENIRKEKRSQLRSEETLFSKEMVLNNMLVVMCKYHRLLTLDELFTHLACDCTHSGLGLHITLKNKHRALTV